MSDGTLAEALRRIDERSGGGGVALPTDPRPEGRESQRQSSEEHRRAGRPPDGVWPSASTSLDDPAASGKHQPLSPPVSPAPSLAKPYRKQSLEAPGRCRAWEGC